MQTWTVKKVNKNLDSGNSIYVVAMFEEEKLVASILNLSYA